MLLARVLLIILLLAAPAASAAPITLLLSGQLGADTPFGGAGTPYTLEIDLDDGRRPSEQNSRVHQYQGIASDLRFVAGSTVINGRPPSDIDNTIVIANDREFPATFGPAVRDDLYGFFDMASVESIRDPHFVFSLVDIHTIEQPNPTGVNGLDLSELALIDLTDFAHQSEPPQVASSALVLRWSERGQSVWDLSSTITSFGVVPQVPEPAALVLLLFGFALLVRQSVLGLIVAVCNTVRVRIPQ